MRRPSDRGLFNKIRQAKTAVKNGAILTVDPIVIAADAIELDYQVGDLNGVISTILNEIRPSNYAGQRPPKKSYKPEIKGKELFAFRWVSKRFGCNAYLKFALKEDNFYLVSLHQHRQKKGGAHEKGD